jgi:hypothetical protein
MNLKTFAVFASSPALHRTQCGAAQVVQKIASYVLLRISYQPFRCYIGAFNGISDRSNQSNL